MRHPPKGLFHGGQRGLRVGELLLPPSKTGAADTIADFASRMVGADWDRDHVYVTPSFTAALMYAAAHPSSGWVYLVEPIGVLLDDPDCTEVGLSFRVSSARIRRSFTPSRRERDLALRALLLETGRARGQQDKVDTQGTTP